LRYILQRRTLYIGQNDELIVGERGEAPQACPTYPELCCHTLNDLDVLGSRERTPFIVDDKVKEVYAEKIIPFWDGKTIREKLFARMTDEWQGAFDAGVFTEFMEQRAFGHAILDDKIYHAGLRDFQKRIEEKRASLDWLTDPRAYDKDEEYKAISIAAEAIIEFAERHADLAEQMAQTADTPERTQELLKIAEVCRHVPAHAPRTFQEALQSYWFIHLGIITELNTWDSFNPGRIDQHLWPFFKDGKTSREEAIELLGCFWLKFHNQPAPPKVGVTELQSGTYQDFALINTGGVTPDGKDAVNDLSYLILDVMEEMHVIMPSGCVQIAEVTPDAFVKRACEVAGTGIGQPSMFNTDAIFEEMLHDGKTPEDARAGGPSGCVTISAFGKEACTLTGYMNWPKIFELTLNDGLDPQTGKRIGPATGDPRGFDSFEQLFEAYQKQLKHFVDLKIAGNNVIERLYANYMPSPYMSLLMDDCIARGKDYHNGGPRYNPTYIQGVGLGTLADALTAVKFHVFEKKTFSMEQLLEALAGDFAGHEDMRQVLLSKTPKYGNDDARADAMARDTFEAYFDVVDGRKNTKGGRYRVNLLPTTVHIYFGAVTGALPCGRGRGVALSEGISPVQGADIEGPTAVLKSAAVIDHARTGGTLLNMKFTPDMLEGNGIERLASLVRAYFTMDGHHVQFNVVDAETLRTAQANPGENRHLIVRVAGYSDYFIDIGHDLQDEIISRTEQKTL
jgi:pyruvate formate-lyase/glycerol dehydratase family glycyl radical enzyme